MRQGDRIRTLRNEQVRQEGARLRVSTLVKAEGGGKSLQAVGPMSVKALRAVALANVRGH